MRDALKDTASANNDDNKGKGWVAKRIKQSCSYVAGTLSMLIPYGWRDGTPVIERRGRVRFVPVARVVEVFRALDDVLKLV
jgi:hypothetical protein